MLLCTALILWGFNLALAVTVGHFGTAPIVAPHSKVTLLSPEENYSYEKYILNTMNSTSLQEMTEYLFELNSNHSINPTNHFKKLTEKIAQKQAQIIKEYVELSPNSNFPNQKADTLQSNYLLNDSEYNWLMKKCLKLKRKLNQSNQNRVRRNTNCFSPSVNWNCVIDEIDNQNVSIIEKNFIEKLYFAYSKLKIKPANFAIIELIADRLRVPELVNLSNETIPLEKVKNHTLKFIQAKMLLNDPPKTNETLAVLTDWSTYAQGEIITLTEQMQELLLIQASKILEAYIEELEKTLELFITPRYYPSKKINSIFLSNDNIIMNITKFKSPTTKDLYVFQPVPICGYVHCIEYSIKPFISTLEMAFTQIIQNCTTYKREYICQKTEPINITCTHGETGCNFKYLGNVEAFDDLILYANKWLVGYLHNRSIFGNLQLSDQVVYFLTTKETEEIELNGKKFVIENSPSALYRYAAKPFRLSRFEIDELAQIQIGGIFSNLTLHPTVNSVFMSLTTLVACILYIVYMVKRNVPVQTFQTRIQDYTMAPQSDTVT